MKALAFSEFGGVAELVRVPADRVLGLPDHVTDEEAAAFVVTHLAAWRMVVTQARVRPGEDVLIDGIGGGASIAAPGIARLCGARVLVTSWSDDKLQRARALGADVGINDAREDRAGAWSPAAPPRERLRRPICVWSSGSRSTSSGPRWTAAASSSRSCASSSRAASTRWWIACFPWRKGRRPSGSSRPAGGSANSD